MTAKRAHDDAFPEDKDTGQQDEVLPSGESHWDWLPLLIRDTILFWKAEGEHRQRIPALRKEIEISHRRLPLGLDALRGQRHRLVLEGGGRTPAKHDSSPTRLARSR